MLPFVTRDCQTERPGGDSCAGVRAGNGGLVLKDALRAVRARRWVLLVGLVAGALLAWGVSATAVPTYESSTQLFVSAANAPDAPSAYQGSLFTQERAPSYAEFLRSTQLAQGVVDELSIPLTARQVAGKVAAVQVPKTDVLQVTVTDSSPQRAQAIASSLTRQFTRWVTQLETPAGTQTSTVKVTTTQPPSFDASPVGPKIGRDVALGGVLGLVLAALWAVARERSSATVRVQAHVREAIGSAVLSSLPKDKAFARLPVSRVLDRSSKATTAAAALDFQLEHLLTGRRSPVVVVSSATPSDGKSTVAVTLAVSMARAGKRVVLVDGNLWQPRVTRFLGLGDAEQGLVDVCAGAVRLGDVLRASADGRLAAVPAGPMPPSTTAVLGSAEMRKMVEDLRSSFDVVLIDSPAVLAAADAVALGNLADGCLLVVRQGATRVEDLAAAVEELRAVDIRVLGVVLNQVPRSRQRGYRSDADRVHCALPATRRAVDEVEPLSR